MLNARRVTVVLFASFALLAAACGDSDDDAGDTTSSTTTASTTTSGGATTTSTTAAPPQSTTTAAGIPAGEIERIQTQLNAVGCFSGAVDGIDGPETTAAVEAFQAAKGLTVDGDPGPQTEAALDEAVANGETVCTGGGGNGGGTGDGTAELSSGNYSASFTVLTCDNPTESSLTLTAENENSIELDVIATGGTGSMSVSGGTEEDSIELTGDVETAMVGDDGTIAVTGTFTGANFAGEAFTIIGSCA